MKKAKVREKIWLSLSVFAAATALLSVYPMAICALHARYLLVALLIAVFAHGAFGFSFYFRAYHTARAERRCSELLSEKLTFEELTERLGMTDKATLAALSGASTRGYIEKINLDEISLKESLTTK